MSNIEQTLSIIKPDAVERNLDNEIKEMLDKEYAFGRPLKEVLKQIWKDDNKGKKFCKRKL